MRFTFVSLMLNQIVFVSVSTMKEYTLAAKVDVTSQIDSEFDRQIMTKVSERRSSYKIKKGFVL